MQGARSLPLPVLYQCCLDGVTHLEFPIAYSEIAESRAEAQEAEAERASLRPVLAPRSIAVIGASRDPQSVDCFRKQNRVMS